MKTFVDKSEILARTAALRRFNLWEEKHTHVMGGQEALAAVGAIYDLLPPESRRRGFDPSGLRAMHLSLSYLDGSS
ncbi:MAG: hypothetical protein JRD02_06490 [Deltaproteobacteria bacterium]|nr:hypothetical protein [Deltaproteobacteria bacterium]